MKITCPYCKGKFNDYLEKCPNCGAVNEGVVRTTSVQPLTIEELKQWYADRKLPPAETTRFFIGVDYREPKAFGIYKDEKGVFTVYKNKADGTRAVRYHGTDEAYAVNELYQRLKQEIIEQKKKNGGGSEDGGKKKPDWFLRIVLGIIGLVVVTNVVTKVLPAKKYAQTGYYAYNTTNYYHINDTYDHHHGHWYEYEDNDWVPVDYNQLPDGLQKEEATDFFMTSSWDPSTQTKDFAASAAGIAYAQEADRWEDSDDDDDYDWDSNDSWDSGDSDWDSDW